MSQPLPVPPDARTDARNRAFRTFVQGLLVDVTVGVLAAVGPSLASSGFAFTKDYWQLIAALAAKTAVMTAVAYVSRKLVPPSF